MRQQEKITQDQMREATALVTRHLGLEVTEAAIHGSLLRGFNDPNSDVDICFLINRPVSDYLHVSTSSIYFESSMDERRKKTMALSATMSRELGWNIMVTLVDMRSLLRGIMGSSIFSLIAYENFAKNNAQVRELFDPVAQKYFNVANLVYRCGEQIQASIRTYDLINPIGQQFKQERTYLGTLWSAHRLLAYISGDTQHSRTIQELIEMNRQTWGKAPEPDSVFNSAFHEGFDPKVLGVIKARTDRSPFDMPQGVSDEATALLKAFVNKVLAEATEYMRTRPHRQPSAMQETIEMVDLYGLLLDMDDEKNQRCQVTQESEEAMA